MPRIQTQLARRILTAFLITFVAARAVVFLIMTRRLPDFYLYLGQTHVHHLNFGIVILSLIAGYLLLVPAAPRQVKFLSIAYGLGLGLTFDEFGMWFHLGGGYWQRASYDAVVIVAAVLALIWFAPSWRHFQKRHWAVSGILVFLLLIFGILLLETLRFASRIVVPKLERLDVQEPKSP